MANKRKSSKGGAGPTEEATETAVEAVDAVEPVDAAPEPKPEPDAKLPEPEDGATPETSEMDAASTDAEAADLDAPQSVEADDSLTPEASASQYGESEYDAPAAVAPEKRASAMPLVFGGIVAAGIGFVAAYIVLPQIGLLEQPGARDALRADLAAQGAAIETLRADLDAAGEVDTGPLEQGLADISAQLETVGEAIAAQDARLGALENRPVGTGSTVVDGDLAALQAALDAQAAEIAALKNEEADREAAARDSAVATLRRAALTQIRTAMDTGSGFEPALIELDTSGVDVPDALAAIAQEGTPSLGALQESFPAAARAALAAARAGGETQEGGGVMFFLSTQLGARSLEPREGPGTDAVLSRAEAALREGRLGDALSEIETLPGAPSAQMDAWAAAAKTRLEASEAVSALAAEVN
ncbi:hypothetical protein KUD11_07545 [Roseovarius sp. LXJ103]|uniref:COG4223 family protein n=1 Tax=Roseovarius carneus TaxID=2853164 RepID=UPI0011B24B4E|nr:hypothetical protein [Roseovarius carneus]MBZ8118502.1 hypothetical protein [Roseovarius carneus]